MTRIAQDLARAERRKYVAVFHCHDDIASVVIRS
jgi:hypothetical protein